MRKTFQTFVQYRLKNFNHDETFPNSITFLYLRKKKNNIYIRKIQKLIFPYYTIMKISTWKSVLDKNDSTKIYEDHKII